MFVSLSRMPCPSLDRSFYGEEEPLEVVDREAFDAICPSFLARARPLWERGILGISYLMVASACVAALISISRFFFMFVSSYETLSGRTSFCSQTTDITHRVTHLFLCQSPYFPLLYSICLLYVAATTRDFYEQYRSSYTQYLQNLIEIRVERTIDRPEQSVQAAMLRTVLDHIPVQEITNQHSLLERAVKQFEQIEKNEEEFFKNRKVELLGLIPILLAPLKEIVFSYLGAPIESAASLLRFTTSLDSAGNSRFETLFLEERSYLDPFDIAPESSRFLRAARLLKYEQAAKKRFQELGKITSQSDSGEDVQEQESADSMMSC